MRRLIALLLGIGLAMPATAQNLEKGEEAYERGDYATLAVDEHAEHYRLRSKGFRLWLGYRYFTAQKGGSNAQAMQDALATLEAKARFEGEEH